MMQLASFESGSGTPRVRCSGLTSLQASPLRIFTTMRKQRGNKSSMCLVCVINWGGKGAFEASNFAVLRATHIIGVCKDVTTTKVRPQRRLTARTVSVSFRDCTAGQTHQKPYMFGFISGSNTNLKMLCSFFGSSIALWVDSLAAVVATTCLVPVELEVYRCVRRISALLKPA